MRKIFNILKTFFPLNLLFSQLQHNIIMLFYWVILFGIVNQYFGMNFGLPYLFLSPEYLHNSGIIAYGLLGAGIGGFIMAFHIYSYIQLGPKYPFIATLSRPFFKFLLNNSILPTAFMINLSWVIFQFQVEQEFAAVGDALLLILSLNIGVVLFMTLAILYFLPTNKDLYAITGKKPDDFQSQSSNVDATLHRHQAWYKPFLRTKEEKYYYFSRIYKIKRSRSSAHYDINVLNRVFSQNHINASVFEILLLITFISLGFFSNYPFFQLPAAVSILIIFTIVIMLVSALFSWFRSWTYIIMIMGLFLVNYLSKKTTWFQFKSYAYGMSYENEKLKPFQREDFVSLAEINQYVENDIEEYQKTLQNWKIRTGKAKPKLVILNTSGGGIRSTMWTFNVLQSIDSLADKEFFKYVQFITGASGGMVGAAYYRDLVLMEQENEIQNRLDRKYLKNASSDLLNRLAFAFSTNDLFFRFQKVEINGHQYTKDRGYAFEEEMKSNFEGAFQRKLGEYAADEKKAKVPTMLLSPSIVNDGRRLLMASQNMSFLQLNNVDDDMAGIQAQIENVEFLRYFQDNNPDEINFSTALRMSASFPYIMPMVNMPTTPNMLVMDAGLRDNYGTKTTARYLWALKDWIEENTSGVVILKVRDTKKTLMGETYENISWFKRFFLPFGSIYGNFPRIQDFDQDELMFATIQALDFPIEEVTLNLREKYEDKISLSWHLTKREKEKVKQAFYFHDNQQAVKRLMKLLKE